MKRVEILPLEDNDFEEANFPSSVSPLQKFHMIFKVQLKEPKTTSNLYYQGPFEIVEDPILLFPDLDKFSIYEATKSRGVISIRGSFPRAPVTPKITLGKTASLRSYSEDSIEAEISTNHQKGEIVIGSTTVTFSLSRSQRGERKRSLSFASDEKEVKLPKFGSKSGKEEMDKVKY